MILKGYRAVVSDDMIAIRNIADLAMMIETKLNEEGRYEASSAQDRETSAVTERNRGELL